MAVHANFNLSHVPPCAPSSWECCASNGIEAKFERFSYLIVFATDSNEFKVITISKSKEEKHALLEQSCPKYFISKLQCHEAANDSLNHLFVNIVHL